MVPAVGGELPTVQVLVAEVDGGVVGHAVASLVAEVAELQRIAVDPAHRRAGLASALLDAVVDAARDAGADHLLLEVRADNAGAVAFYAHHGFAEIDRRPRYYRDGAAAVGDAAAAPAGVLSLGATRRGRSGGSPRRPGPGR